MSSYDVNFRLEWKEHSLTFLSLIKLTVRNVLKKEETQTRIGPATSSVIARKSRKRKWPVRRHLKIYNSKTPYNVSLLCWWWVSGGCLLPNGQRTTSAKMSDSNRLKNVIQIAFGLLQLTGAEGETSLNIYESTHLESKKKCNKILYIYEAIRQTSGENLLANLLLCWRSSFPSIPVIGQSVGYIEWPDLYITLRHIPIPGQSHFDWIAFFIFLPISNLLTCNFLCVCSRESTGGLAEFSSLLASILTLFFRVLIKK